MIRSLDDLPAYLLRQRRTVTTEDDELSEEAKRLGLELIPPDDPRRTRETYIPGMDGP